jgi:hypothetical protein
MQKANKLHITNDLMNVILAISLFFYSAYYISGALSANLHTTGRGFARERILA